MEKCIPGQYDSWLIVSEVTAIKHTDSSFFNYNGSGIPRATKAFWGIQADEERKIKEVILWFNGKQYKGRVKVGLLPSKRATISWKVDLGKIFSECYPGYQNFAAEEYPKVQFNKMGSDIYELVFLDSHVTYNEERGILKTYQNYSRENINQIFNPEVPYVGNYGTWGMHGVIKVPNTVSDYIFIVTLGSKTIHGIEETLSEDGTLIWRSQDRTSLSSKEAIKWINHDEEVDNIHLFLRLSKKIKTFTYLGRLAYITHNNELEKPVFFKWQILNWNSEKAKQTLGTDILSPIETRTISRTERGLILVAPIKTERNQNGSSSNFFVGRDIDFQKEQEANTELGLLGEECAIEYEKQQLAEIPELAEKVLSSSVFIGTNAPFDIKSYTIKGKTKYIEVKTTTKGPNTPFFVSKRELEFSKEYAKNYYLYRIYNFNPVTKSGEFFIHEGSLEDICEMEPVNYKCTIKN